MLELILLVLGNSFGMFITNVVCGIAFIMLSWFVVENLYLPERVSIAINEKTGYVPNWFIIQIYMLFCVLTIIFL